MKVQKVIGIAIDLLFKGYTIDVNVYSEIIAKIPSLCPQRRYPQFRPSLRNKKYSFISAKLTQNQIGYS